MKTRLLRRFRPVLRKLLKRARERGIIDGQEQEERRWVHEYANIVDPPRLTMYHTVKTIDPIEAGGKLFALKVDDKVLPRCCFGLRYALRPLLARILELERELELETVKRMRAERKNEKLTRA